MVQKARPASDISTGAWTATPLWSKVDEVTPDDDTTKITSDNPNSDTMEVKLTAVTDPVSSTGHIVSFRAKTGVFDPEVEESICGMQIIPKLVQGTTVISTGSTVNLTSDWATYSWTLTAGEADNITDYGDLRVRLTADLLNITVDCCVNDIPCSLTCTVSNVSNCACGAVSITLLWDSEDLNWQGSGTFCSTNINLTLRCPGGSSSCSDFRLDFSFDSGCQGSATKSPKGSPACACDPLDITFNDLTFTNLDCCDGADPKLAYVVGLRVTE